MSTFWQTVVPVVISAALTLLLAYRGAISRTSKLYSAICDNAELLDKLPADHPRRATLKAHNGTLLDILTWRQYQQFHPLAPPASLAPLPARPRLDRFVPLLILAGLLEVAYLLGGLTGVYRLVVPPELLWSALVFYAIITVAMVGLIRSTDKLDRQHRRLLRQVSEMTAPEGSA
jgi:hypothetical protein